MLNPFCAMQLNAIMNILSKLFSLSLDLSSSYHRPLLACSYSWLFFSNCKTLSSNLSYLSSILNIYNKINRYNTYSAPFLLDFTAILWRHIFCPLLIIMFCLHPFRKGLIRVTLLFRLFSLDTFKEGSKNDLI
jgi:hypothetical protein